MRNKALLHTTSLVLTSILLLSYNDDPPAGRTGAPFDGHCNNCHTNNNPFGYNGMAEIIGLPDTLQPSTTYSLQLKATPTAGSPIKAGFQLVVVDNNDINAGNLTATDPNTDTDFLAGREYLEHRGAKYFGGTSVTWSFDWTSPPNPDTLDNAVQFYYIVNFCNGGGDLVITLLRFILRSTTQSVLTRRMIQLLCSTSFPIRHRIFFV